MKTEPTEEFQPFVKPGKFYALRVWIFLMRLRLRESLRLKKRIQWFHRRFRVRYLDGSPWHGLARFNASTASNILFASGKRKSAFFDLMDRSPGLAEGIIAEAYAGVSWKKVLDRCNIDPAFCSADVIEAAKEAVEIYSPKP